MYQHINFGFLHLISTFMGDLKSIPYHFGRNTGGNPVKFISIKWTIKYIYGFSIQLSHLLINVILILLGFGSNIAIYYDSGCVWSIDYDTPKIIIEFLNEYAHACFPIYIVGVMVRRTGPNHPVWCVPSRTGPLPFRFGLFFGKRPRTAPNRAVRCGSGPYRPKSGGTTRF